MTSSIAIFLLTVGGFCSNGKRAALHGNLAIDLRDPGHDLVIVRYKLANTEVEERMIKKMKNMIDSDDDVDSDVDKEEEEDTF